MTPKERAFPGKLFELKDWLTIPEVAIVLSGLLEETIEEKDVLRLSLDNHLTLSVNFVNGTDARVGRIGSHEDIMWEERPLSDLNGMGKNRYENSISDPNHSKILNEIFSPSKILKSLVIDEQRCLNLESKVKNIKGVWDLPMIGAEKLEVEKRYYGSIGGPTITSTVLVSPSGMVETPRL